VALDIEVVLVAEVEASAIEEVVVASAIEVVAASEAGARAGRSRICGTCTCRSCHGKEERV